MTVQVVHLQYSNINFETVIFFVVPVFVGKLKNLHWSKEIYISFD